MAGPGDDLGDTRAAATPLEFAYGRPGSVADEMGRPEDVDLIRIELRGGDRVALTLESTSTGESPFFGVLRVFGEATNVDASQEHRLDFTAAAPGVFHVGVSGLLNDEYDPDRYDESLFGFTGSYRLSFIVTAGSTEIPPGNDPDDNLPPDNTPPDNNPPDSVPPEQPAFTIPPAPALPTEEVKQGTITVAGARHTYPVTVAAASHLDANVSAGPNAVRLTLLDAGGSALVTSGDGRLVQHLAPGNYTLSVEAIGEAPIDYQLATKLSAATSPRDDYRTGDGVTALATGDFTGDGLLDAVRSNAFEGTLQFLVGLGDGTFAPQTPFMVGPAISALQASDFTGDGRTDLAVAFADRGSVVLYTGGPNGWFSSARELTASGGAAALESADIDGDGVQDLAVATSGSPAIEIFMRLQDGAGPTTRTVALPAVAVAVAAGDVNGDGRADLVAALGAANQAVVLEQAADGTFVSRTLNITGQPTDVAIGDFDGDGDVDLAVGLAEGGNVALARRAADGSYALQAIVVDLDRKTSTAGSAIRTVLRAADFNADGRLDLAVANTFSREAAILLQRASLGLTPVHRVLLSNSIVALDAADLNADGRGDLIAANDDAEHAGVAVRLGRGNGSFQQDPRLPVGTDPHALAAADFNSDGRVDLVSTSFTGLTVQMGLGDGAFGAPLRIAADQPHAIVTGDFNRDGRPDLAVTFPFQGAESRVDRRIGVWLGLGDGTFRDAVFYQTGELPLDVAAGDFNGDGALDLATANGLSNDVTVLLGAGDGTFTLVARLAAAEQPTAIIAADVDGDGKLDLAVANEASDSVSLWRGIGDGQFAAWTTLSTGDAPSDLVVADLDGDGRVDLATADHGAGSLSIFYQTPSGDFTRSALNVGEGPRSLTLLAGDSTSRRLAVTLDAADRVVLLESTVARAWNRGGEFATGRTPISVVASDVNQDQRPDLAVLNAFTNDVTLLLGDGESLRPATSDAPALTDGTPTFADLNGDGAVDSLVVRQSGEVLLRLGRVGKPGEFDAPRVVNPGRGAIAVEVLQAADGLRIATLDRGANRVSLYRVSANGTMELVEELNALAGAVRFAAGDLNGDGLGDVAVVNAGGSMQFWLSAAGGWTSRELATGANSPAELRIVDVDGRLGADVILADSRGGDVRLYLNAGGAAFAAPLVYRVGVGPYWIAPLDGTNLASFQTLEDSTVFVQGARDGTATLAFADFDGDALPDLLALNAGSNMFSLLTGAGANGFGGASHVLTGDRPTSAAIGDFNRDGRNDLAILLSGESRLAIYLGDGRGGFNPGASYAAGNLPLGVAATDVNGDGMLDLAVGNAFGDLMTFRGRGDGTFDDFERSGNEIPLAVADVNGDGVPEVIVANPARDRISVQQTDGPPPAEGTFTARRIFEQQRAGGLLAPGAVETVDLNGDGRIDLLVANSGGNELLVYLGRGDGTFDDARSFYAGTNPAGITISDINSDGRLDVAVANAGSNDVSVLLGDANDLLRPGPRLAVGNAPVASQAGDFNGDGHTDLLVANSGSDSVSLLLGVGGGFFDDRQAIVFPTGADPRTLLVGEFDGRAGTDLVTVNAGGGSLTVYSNFLSPTLSATTISTGGLRPTSAVARDFNADGRLDLVVANKLSGSLSLLLGGDGGLSLSAVIADFELDRPSSLELIDFGGETGLRLLVTHEGDEQPRLFTPKDFLPRESDRLEPIGPNAGLLLTLFQSGLRFVASSVIVLPTLSPEAAEFLAQLLGNDFGAEVDADGAAVDRTDSWLGQLRQAAETLFDSLGKSLEGVVAAWNFAFQDDSTVGDWLTGAGEILQWLEGDAGANETADEAEALAAVAAAIARRLDSAAADAILSSDEAIPIDQEEVAPRVEVAPRTLPDEPARAMRDVNNPATAPITPAVLEQPLEDAKTLPPVEAGALGGQSPRSVAWPWQVWGAAVALGCGALGAGGIAARRRWGRRQLEPLAIE